MFSIGLLGILFVILLGLGVIGVTLVIVVIMSRRDEFINPFSGRKPNPQPVREVSTPQPFNVQPTLYSQSGADPEAALVDWLVAQASAQTGVNLKGDPMVHERIINAVQNGMKELELQDTTQISLPFLTADGSGPKHFEIKITRQMMEKIQ